MIISHQLFVFQFLEIRVIGVGLTVVSRYDIVIYVHNKHTTHTPPHALRKATINNTCGHGPLVRTVSERGV